MAAAPAALHGGDPRIRSWSDLPLDLAAAVLRRLPPRPLDRARFGAVCRQWRAAAQENPAMPPHFPWLALADRTFYSLPDTAFRPLPVHLDGHRQMLHAQSSCGEWLVFERHDGAITLMSPLSAAAGTILLPGLHTLLYPAHNDVHGLAIRKLVVCSDKLVAALVVGEPNVRLALCRPGAASWSWAIVGGANVIVQDIILYQGQLYAFSRDRCLTAVSITVDGHEPAVSSVDRVINSGLDSFPFNPCYLLESGGALLMISNYTSRSGGGHPMAAAAARFTVYVASFERSRWTMARGDILEAVSDGRALFLGPWCSRSVAVGGPDQRGSVGGNSIVFFTYERFYDDRKSMPFCCGVFNLKTRRLQQSLLQTSVQPLEGFRATWLFPPSQP
ncbi:hypothetical protein QYE76_029151 [Lolium multiflorum]|uniref:DUF295 domain-containing protein n=1 Tax=Lolium multiflorum TaxID=4521 RepID=A0AAD8VI02_LOLMU|nr:hypothetical protein QYE76_029151 [Lolium multiflorum]